MALIMRQILQSMKNSWQHIRAAQIFGKTRMSSASGKGIPLTCLASPGPRSFSVSRFRSSVSKSTSSLSGIHQPRYVYVRTCMGKWEDVPNGLAFDLGYVDSHPGAEQDDQTPTVVALHGLLSSHENLLPVLEPLVNLGYRVIAPNFPGNDYTGGLSSAHDDVFFHTTDERAEIVGDFLLNIGINRVDAVIGFNEGCYPAIRLSMIRPEMFRSVVVVCPSGHRPYRVMPDLDPMRTVSNLWDKLFLRPVLRPFIKLGAVYMGYGHVRVKHIIPAMRTALNVGYEEFGSFLVTLDEMQHPRCMMYSANDTTVESEISAEYADLLGIASTDFTCVGKDGKVVRKGTTETFPRGVIFEEGGHYPQKKHSDVIVYTVRDIIKYVRSSVKNYVNKLS